MTDSLVADLVAAIEAYAADDEERTPEAVLLTITGDSPDLITESPQA